MDKNLIQFTKSTSNYFNKIQNYLTQHPNDYLYDLYKETHFLHNIKYYQSLFLLNNQNQVLEMQKDIVINFAKDICAEMNIPQQYKIIKEEIPLFYKSKIKVPTYVICFKQNNITYLKVYPLNNLELKPTVNVNQAQFKKQSNEIQEKIEKLKLQKIALNQKKNPDAMYENDQISVWEYFARVLRPKHYAKELTAEIMNFDDKINKLQDKLTDINMQQHEAEENKAQYNENIELITNYTNKIKQHWSELIDSI